LQQTLLKNGSRSINYQEKAVLLNKEGSIIISPLIFCNSAGKTAVINSRTYQKTKIQIITTSYKKIHIKRYLLILIIEHLYF
jgi:hypothetical protein